MVKQGTFRDDLYYRLHAAAILVPPLRDRREAIPAFVAHFVEHYNRLFGKDVKLVSRAAIEAICAHPWAGNIRELGHAIESAVLMTETDRITVEDLPMHVIDRGTPMQADPIEDPLDDGAPLMAEVPESGAEKNWPYSLYSAILDASKLALIRALQATQGNCHRAADLLGASRYTFHRMLNRSAMAQARSYRDFSQTDRAQGVETLFFLGHTRTG